MPFKNTIEKAYGSIPKEPLPSIDIDTSWVPSFRGIKYYWIKFIRSFRKVK